jgi:hypothetical protein
MVETTLLAAQHHIRALITPFDYFNEVLILIGTHLNLKMLPCNTFSESKLSIKLIHYKENKNIFFIEQT